MLAKDLHRIFSTNLTAPRRIDEAELIRDSGHKEYATTLVFAKKKDRDAFTKFIKGGGSL